MGIPRISIKEYNYELEDSRIAKYPVEPKDASKLLIFNAGNILHRHFYDLPEFLNPLQPMVVNNTKVIPARLWFKKDSGALIQLFLLKPLTADWTKWEVMVGNRRKFKEGETIGLLKDSNASLKVRWLNREENTIEFILTDTSTSIPEIIEELGEIPLPPYLNRDSEDRDRKDYQAIFAKQRGAVAAPTASLHFTDSLIQRIEATGIHRQEVTLHVGAGTFKPVSSDFVDEHEMHAEQFSITSEVLRNIIDAKNGVLAVGTTAARVLESLPLLGAKCLLGERKEVFVSSDDGYREDLKSISTRDALTALLEWVEMEGGVLNGETQIFMVPGFDFRVTQRMITNFHQPKSTLILLIAAFIGDDWERIYQEAINRDYRFLSYGDGSLLVGKKKIII